MPRLQWGHDLAVMESSPECRRGSWSSISFNGAMTLRSWRDGFDPVGRGGLGLLQWGHDLAVMERRLRTRT